MACYLKCYITPNWMDEEYEWKRRLHVGQTMMLGKKDMPYGLESDDMEENQVSCKVDMINKVVFVTRIGLSHSRDNCFKQIGLGETVEIADGQWFSMSGKEDGIHVTFEKNENGMFCDGEEDQGSPHEGEILYKGVWYDESSHSLNREMRNGDRDNDDDDQVQEMNFNF